MVKGHRARRGGLEQRSRQYRASARRVDVPNSHSVSRAVPQRGFVPIFVDMFPASY
jgi:hypothetical protein